MDQFGWQTALLIFAGSPCLILPLSLRSGDAAGRATSGCGGALPPQSFRHAMDEAFGHRSYVLLVLGFFTCGFQLAFTTVHLPSYLIDRGLSAEVGGWTLATIGLFNIIGSLTSGYLGNRMPKRYLLSAHLFRPRDLDLWRSSRCRSPRPRCILRRRHRPAVALDRAADLRHSSR